MSGSGAADGKASYGKLINVTKAKINRFPGLESKFTGKYLLRTNGLSKPQLETMIMIKKTLK